MAVSYNRLYKVLEEKNVTMVELRKAADSTKYNDSY